MAQYDLYLIRNDHATGVEFAEIKLAKPSVAGRFFTQDPTTGALSWGQVDWAHVGGKPSTFAPSAHNHEISEVNGLTAALNAKVSTSVLGAANGVAQLDAGGKVPANQLPSYVDDVLEFTNLAAFPPSGESGKIYTAIDTNKIYRWSGTGYIEISPTAGNADTATKLATPRSIATTGDAAWSVNFDGSANVSAAITLANVVTAGTKTKITYNAKGLVTAGADLAAADIPVLDAAKITTGTFDVARIPDLNASKINAGTLHVDRIPSLATSKITGLDTALGLKLQWASIPTTITSSGTVGQIAYSSNYIYVCVGSNSWRRVPLSSWSGSVE